MIVNDDDKNHYYNHYYNIDDYNRHHYMNKIMTMMIKIIMIIKAIIATLRGAKIHISVFYQYCATGSTTENYTLTAQ